jgi:hypothetical protein
LQKITATKSAKYLLKVRCNETPQNMSNNQRIGRQARV